MQTFNKLQMLYNLYQAIYTIGHMPQDHGMSSELHKELDQVRTETIRALLTEEIEEILNEQARLGVD